jgi:hypothetical protein
MATESPKTRTLTGYMVFAMEQRSTVEKDQPTLKFAEISVELGKRWKALTDEQKAAYNTKGKETVIEVKPKKAKKAKTTPAAATPVVVATPVVETAKKGKGKKGKASETPVATPAVVVAEPAKPTKGKKGKAAKATETVDTTTSAPVAEKPKRGKNAFMYFLDEHRASVKAQLTEAKQDAGVTDVTKKVSEMWKALTDAEKAPFVEKSKNKV